MNMSYCRFHNTTIDLNECLNVLEEQDNLKDLSESEIQCVIKLLTTQYDRLTEIRNSISYDETNLNPEYIKEWIKE